VTYVVYDSGALIAAERNDKRFAALHRRWLGAGVTPVVPPVVLAQVWRDGRRQAQLSRLIAGCRPLPLDFERARMVGELMTVSGTRDIVDAAVVVAARELRPVAVVTSDRGDIAQLASALGISLPIVDV
jgi:rRNA-processing protein FCF1